MSWFQNLFDTGRKIAARRKEYNQERPHGSLENRKPKEFGQQATASRFQEIYMGQEASNAGALPHAPVPGQTGCARTVWHSQDVLPLQPWRSSYDPSGYKRNRQSADGNWRSYPARSHLAGRSLRVFALRFAK
ncbi:MAG: transposase [Acidobacteriia bacterium]|nr:transposase [Terriglobia bacterium]